MWLTVGTAAEFSGAARRGTRIASHPAKRGKAMAARIASLLNQPDQARKMGERGRAVVEQRFSCAAQLAAIERLYDQLLAAHAQRRTSRVANVQRGVA